MFSSLSEINILNRQHILMLKQVQINVNNVQILQHYGEII